MLTHDATVSRDKLKNLIDVCTRLLEVPAMLPLLGDGRVLVSALGLSPGVLFSALKLVSPDRLLVVTSHQAASSLEEVMRIAGFPSSQHRSLVVEDPHNCFDDDRLKEHDGDLVQSSEVVVNMTGGTTALQWLVARVAERAAALAVPVRRVALIDRRPPEVQRAQPYVLGELKELPALDGLPIEGDDGS
jgi:hypothetical protein